MTVWSLDRMARLQVKAIQFGAKVHRHEDCPLGKSSTVEWDISGVCQNSKPVEIIARNSVQVVAVTKRKLARFRAGVTDFLRIIMHTACRKCDACRRKRQRMWYQRSRAEYEAAARNWFGTLTLSPEQHFQCETRIRHLLDKQGVDFEALSGSEKFSLRVKEMGKLVTLWLKRVRKNSGAHIRYLMVCEAHKSGLPHVHVLIHEQSISEPVRWSVLAEAWQYGFSSFKLAKDPKSALYLTKYLTKSIDVRVRASIEYGRYNPLEDSFSKERLLKNVKLMDPNITTGLSPRESDNGFIKKGASLNGNSVCDFSGTTRLSECAEEAAGAAGAPTCGPSAASTGDASSRSTDADEISYAEAIGSASEAEYYSRLRADPGTDPASARKDPSGGSGSKDPAVSRKGQAGIDLARIISRLGGGS